MVFRLCVELPCFKLKCLAIRIHPMWRLLLWRINARIENVDATVTTAIATVTLRMDTMSCTMDTTYNTITTHLQTTVSISISF